MTIDYLPRKQAEQVFQRLAGKGKKLPEDEKLKKFMSPGDSWGGVTLAMVYGAARDAGWTPPSKEKKKGMVEEIAANEGRIVASKFFGENFMVYPGKGWNPLT